MDIRSALRVQLGIAAAAFAGFLALGAFVTRFPASALDQAGFRWLGIATPLAVVFTRSGYAPALIGVGIVGIAVALILRANVAAPILLIAVQFASQLAANAFKQLYHRARPDAWLFRSELGFSYPSGHAVTAIVFYVGWALIVWSWPLPKSARIAIACTMALWAVGIGFSRIALGAHHVTDVLGGYLFGTAWLFVFLALASLLRSSGSG